MNIFNTAEVKDYVNGVKDAFNKLRDTISESVHQEMAKLQKHVHNFNVVVMPDHLKDMPQELKDLFPQLPNAFATKVFGQEYIMVNDKFFELSEATQEAILWHEAGHIHHGHTQASGFKMKMANNLRPLKAILGEVDKRELEADAYAAEHVGNKAMMAALTELAQVIEAERQKNPVAKANFAPTIKELQMRVMALQGW